ncbi:hypothetical protein N7931_03230 [Catenovulum sp. 2E275]|uniref:hypothetical protein n=1 Tax=Catenovulum sp. 2E275 TaxID=2980497 RepID=UPI0021D0E595|nr:hypothetical protein [Catenovulum sp. 2E275]MCU4674637.1 hypothetical protein [Catenovulum sp. 2E275]
MRILQSRIFQSISFGLILNLSLVINLPVARAQQAEHTELLWQQQSPVGSARLTYLWWKVYDSEFYCEQRNGLKQHINATQKGKSVSDQQVYLEMQTLIKHCQQLALKIHYLRDIDKVDLVKETEKQWRHLSFTEIDFTPWLNQLTQIWPNLKQADELIFMVKNASETSPNLTAQFYYNNRLIGELNDSKMIYAFAAIWLSQATSEPELREKLFNF